MESIVLQYGFVGVVVMAEAAVIRFLYTENKALYKRLDELQESRITDARDTRDKIGEQMEINNRVQKLIYDKLFSSKQGS